MARVWWSATQIVASLVEGDELAAHLGRLHGLLAYTPANTIQNRQRIAEFLLDNDSL
jgi:hypothetical protein